MTKTVSNMGTWKPPASPIHDDLGNGYVLVETAVLDEGIIIEGLAYYPKSRFELRHEGLPITIFEADTGMDPEEFYEQYLASSIDDPTGRIKNTYMRHQPQAEKTAVRELAETIWMSGQSLEYMRETCAKYHIGDSGAMASIILAYAATLVKNSDGIHVSISGSTGSGKSHAVETATKCLPKHKVIKSRFTDKAIVYHDLEEGSMLVMDDQEMTETSQELMKSLSSNWNDPPSYLTVFSGKPVILKLPPRCVYIVCKANLNGDEQVLDRQIVLWTDESGEQTKAIRSAIVEKVKNPQILEEEESDMKVCRAIWECVMPESVKIPFADQVIYSPSMEPRNFKLFFALIQASALLHAPIRERDEEGNLLAEEGDCRIAEAIMNPLLKNVGGSQIMKLSSAAAKVLAYLKTQDSGVIPYSEIRRATGMSMSQLTHAFNGRSETKNDGLLASCNALELVTLSDSEGDDLSRRTTSGRKAVRWSRETYQAYEYLSNGFIGLDTFTSCFPEGCKG